MKFINSAVCGAALLVFCVLPVSAVLLTAHRGASYDAPENTLASFNLAWQQNADGIEGDFYLSSDGHVVCIHDSTTARTGDTNLMVSTSTLAELKTVDVGSFKGSEWTDERIPTLEEVISTIPSGKYIQIEIKVGVEIVEPIAQILEASSLTDDQIIIICFNQAVVTAAKARLPDSRVLWLASVSDTSPTAAQVLTVLQTTGADGVGASANATVIDADYCSTVHANGTYQHSLTVGSIVETAAVAIGANPVACKVMAYFHDIGKLERPEYFAENQIGVNKHTELSPSMSAKIIINHVKYGRELAKKYHLGERIEAAAYQHHGTSLVRYFLMEAQKSDKRASEEIFRYKAEKPQTREVGLIMIADACEASVKSIKEEKTYDRIGDKVRLIISSIMNDGQLSDCNMTLNDIAKISESVIKTLSGIYHVRPEYGEEQNKGKHENRKQKQHSNTQTTVG